MHYNLDIGRPRGPGSRLLRRFRTAQHASGEPGEHDRYDDGVETRKDASTATADALHDSLSRLV